MRALICTEYGDFENLVIDNLDDPVPGDNEILFDVHAAALNFADLLAVAGKYQVRTPPPFVPGNEAAGIVTAVGAGVSNFKPGDRIIGALRGGGFAEQAVVDERFALPMPGRLDFEQAAAYSVAYGTSYHALKQAGLQPGERVLVLGAAGGVGYAAVELAKAMGATVIAAASTREKLDFAAEAGADYGIDYSEEPLRKAVGNLTDGLDVDVVYDPVGGDLAEQALRATAWHGRYLVVGFASGEIPCLPLNLALLKEASIIGTWYGTWAAKHPDAFAEDARELRAMVESGKISPRYSAAYDLGQFAAAFRLLAGRRALGKVVLRMRDA
ncbi:MAG: NADPH:quinone oxidoreductase family protein [Woeseiaceae bacterium]